MKKQKKTNTGTQFRRQHKKQIIRKTHKIKEHHMKKQNKTNTGTKHWK